MVTYFSCILRPHRFEIEIRGLEIWVYFRAFYETRIYFWFQKTDRLGRLKEVQTTKHLSRLKEFDQINIDLCYNSMDQIESAKKNRLKRKLILKQKRHQSNVKRRHQDSEIIQNHRILEIESTSYDVDEQVTNTLTEIPLTRVEDLKRCLSQSRHCQLIHASPTTYPDTYTPWLVAKPTWCLEYTVL
uniref:Uncharacterized protein n=1 Tax=Ananas comosus var. bracteatus TaxID=296719 RepID=A0A6V7Q2B6_ANACO|nr:unnamed protein product [Ananas comosus var. bracteatus]